MSAEDRTNAARSKQYKAEIQTALFNLTLTVIFEVVLAIYAVLAKTGSI